MNESDISSDNESESDESDWDSDWDDELDETYRVHNARNRMMEEFHRIEDMKRETRALREKWRLEEEEQEEILSSINQPYIFHSPAKRGGESAVNADEVMTREEAISHPAVSDEEMGADLASETQRIEEVGSDDSEGDNESVWSASCLDEELRAWTEEALRYRSDTSAEETDEADETDETANAEEVTDEKIGEPDEAPEADAGHAQSSYEYARAANKAVAAVVMEKVWDPGRSDMGFSPVYHRKKPGDVFE